MDGVCRKCGIEMRVHGSRYVLEMQGETPKLFTVLDISCDNDQCTEKGVPIEIKHELPLGNEKDESE